MVGQGKPSAEKPAKGGFLRTPWPNFEAPQYAVQCFPVVVVLVVVVLVATDGSMMRIVGGVVVVLIVVVAGGDSRC